MELRTGIDLIEISRLGGLNPAIRRRFLARVFTPLELQLSLDDASLAGRFAAKEAVAKALGCGIGQVGWQEIEVCRGGNGEPRLVLHGAAAREAQQQQLVTWAVSITHTSTHAAAVAVALGRLEPSTAIGEQDRP